jgi:DinB family protein
MIPQTKQDVLQALANLGIELVFWLAIEPARFARPIGQAWSPADTIRHLFKSTVPVTRALKLPRPLLRILFRRGLGASMAYYDLVERYRSVLASGGNAGRFSPSPVRAPANISLWQQNLVSECRAAIVELARALERWTETDLDHCRLPHPLLGKITIREMLFFTLYHYEHHRAIVAERIVAFGD